MTLKGQVAIVTGAGQGIGFEICRRLARAEAKVILNDLDVNRAADGARSITDENGICIAVPGDASRIDIIQQLVATAVSQFGRLDIVIANAGITVFGDFFTYTPEYFSRVMEVNLKGSFFLAQAAANQLKKQLSGGSILFISSVTGHQAHKNLAAYGMSKAALEMLAKSLVIELSQYKININAIAPGATLTQRTMAESEDYAGTWSKLIPMGKPATVDDIANAVLFFVSGEARHITGQTLIVDGGWTCTSPSPYEK